VNLNDPNIPIIGQNQPRQQEPNAPGLTAKIEIHDSEIMEIERIVAALNERLGSSRRTNLDAFNREIYERFAEIGFIVQVAWWDTNIPGVLIPEICISDRTERKDFDHDRQVHEVTNDILELGDKGVIKTDPAAMKALEQQHAGHKH
jgi:hypothetical protein